MLKSTRQIFIEKAINVHDLNKFTYDNVIYINSTTKIKIFCVSCNIEFEQTPSRHLSGSGHKAYMNRYMLTTDLFIKKSIQKHGIDKFKYDKIIYINHESPVSIFCNKCNQYFEQIAAYHLSGNGCNLCIPNKKNNTSSFIEEAKQIHGDKFNYDKVIYINNYSKVEIFCYACKEYFWQVPKSHIKGFGCSRCSGNFVKTKEGFIAQSDIKHNYAYNYSKIDYVNVATKVEIICKENNHSFWQPPSAHLAGNGCYQCLKNSKKNLIWFVEKANAKHFFRLLL